MSSTNRRGNATINKGDIAALKASGIIYRIEDESYNGNSDTVETIKYLESSEPAFQVAHGLLTRNSRPLTEQEKQRFPHETQFWAG